MSNCKKNFSSKNTLYGSSATPTGQRENIFARIERTIFVHLREQNWAEGIQQNITVLEVGNFFSETALLGGDEIN